MVLWFQGSGESSSFSGVQVLGFRGMGFSVEACFRVQSLGFNAVGEWLVNVATHVQGADPEESNSIQTLSVSPVLGRGL